MSLPIVLPTDDQATVVDLFLALVQIDSPSCHEGTVAAAITQWLDAKHIPWTVDDAQAVTGSDTGNIIVRLQQDPSAPTLLFVAHMDTVQTVDQHVVPVVGDDGIIRSQGDTILGSDNKASVAALLYLLGSNPAANILAVFSTSEEKGCMGITAIKDIVADVDFAFPIDGSWPLGTIFVSALGHLPFSIRVQGRSAHAAKEPQMGVHAVQAAARIVAGLPLGWQGETVANVGRITGGGASNVVPDTATVEGEIRGFSEAALQQRIASIEMVVQQVAIDTGASIELVLAVDRKIPPFPQEENEAGEALLTTAMQQVGLTPQLTVCQATMEANFLSAMGLPTLGIATGNDHPHAVDEQIAATDLQRLGELLRSLVAAANNVSH